MRLEYMHGGGCGHKQRDGRGRREGGETAERRQMRGALTSGREAGVLLILENKGVGDSVDNKG